MIASCKKRGSFTNAFSSNLNTNNLKVFPNHGGTSKDLSLRLYLKGFKCCAIFCFSHVDTEGIDLLLEKLSPEIEG